MIDPVVDALVIEFVLTEQQDRGRFGKLSAILRLAESLDRGHRQRITGFTLEKTELELVIRPAATGDITMEKIGALEQSEDFEDVFGLKLVLARGDDGEESGEAEA